MYFSLPTHASHSIAHSVNSFCPILLLFLRRFWVKKFAVKIIRISRLLPDDVIEEWMVAVTSRASWVERERKIIHRLTLHHVNIVQFEWDFYFILSVELNVSRKRFSRKGEMECEREREKEKNNGFNTHFYSSACIVHFEWIGLVCRSRKQLCFACFILFISI